MPDSGADRKRKRCAGLLCRLVVSSGSCFRISRASVMGFFFFSFSYFILHIAHNCKNSRILFSNTSLIMLLIGTLFIYFFHFVRKEHNNDVVLTKKYTEVL
jgi:hypothetical protein